LHEFSGFFVLKWGFWGKIWEGWYNVDPNELVFTFGFFVTSVSILVKIYQEMRSRECAQIDRHTQAGFVICLMLYAIAMGQIMTS